MNSKRYETTCTVTVAGDEKDVAVRANVLLEPGPSGWSATLDSDVEFRIGRSWVSANEVELDDGDLARATEALEEMAFDDDSSECVEYGDDDRVCA